jgi:hypothetical protein
MFKRLTKLGFYIALIAYLLTPPWRLSAQEADNHAGHVPLISGGMGYIQNVNGGVTSLEPQINPVLLVPFGSHLLLESRVDFTGFFQHEHQTDGSFTGKVFKTVEFAQVDWLANTHVIATFGRYLLPFGIYNERLQPIWIKNLQDSPITATIGTRSGGAGTGPMARGVVLQTPSYSAQYSAYYSIPSSVEQLGSLRLVGGDGSLFWLKPRLEAGGSYQRVLQDRHINNVAAYLSWQPRNTHIDVKTEYDYSYYGNGYWLETAYVLDRYDVPAFFRRIQVVGRIQQFVPLHGGGNALPRVNQQRFDVGLNYNLRDDLRIVSSYGRVFSSQGDANVWNVGLTYRFNLPLWPEGK